MNPRNCCTLHTSLAAAQLDISTTLCGFPVYPSGEKIYHCGLIKLFSSFMHRWFGGVSPRQCAHDDCGALTFRENENLIQVNDDKLVQHIPNMSFIKFWKIAGAPKQHDLLFISLLDPYQVIRSMEVQLSNSSLISGKRYQFQSVILFRAQ